MEEHAVITVEYLVMDVRVDALVSVPSDVHQFAMAHALHVLDRVLVHVDQHAEGHVLIIVKLVGKVDKQILQMIKLLKMMYLLDAQIHHARQCVLNHVQYHALEKLEVPALVVALHVNPLA